MSLTPKEVLVVFLHVEHNGTCQLDLGEQVEVSEDEENLALLLKLRDHVLLIRKKVVVHVGIAHVVLLAEVAACVQDVVLSVLAVPKRENVVAALDHEQGEVEVGQLEIDVPNLAFSLGRRA